MRQVLFLAFLRLRSAPQSSSRKMICTSPFLTATCRQVSPSASLEFASPPPSRNSRTSSRFEWKTAHHIAFAPLPITHSLISRLLTTMPLRLSSANWLPSTIFTNSPSLILPLRACLLLSSPAESRLTQKEVQLLMGRRVTRTQGCRMLLIFMFTRRSRPSTARTSILLPGGYSRCRDSSFSANCLRLASRDSSSSTAKRFCVKTARHLAWMRTMCLTMLGEERKTCFLERSTTTYRSSCLGPPDSCFLKWERWEESSLSLLSLLMESSKAFPQWKRSEGMQARYLRRCEYWSSRFMILLEGYFSFSLQSRVASEAGCVRRLKTSLLWPGARAGRATACLSFAAKSLTHLQTRSLSRSLMRSLLTIFSNIALYFTSTSRLLPLLPSSSSALAAVLCSCLRICVSSSQYLALRSDTRFMSWRQVAMIFSAMLVSSLLMRWVPALWTLFLILRFSDLARLLLRKSEVAQRYLTSSGVMPALSRCSHLRQMLSRALTVSVYFLTNWKSTGMLLILRLLLKAAFFARNDSSSRCVQRFSRNSLLSLIFTLQNQCQISLCTLRARTEDQRVLLRAESLAASRPSRAVVGSSMVWRGRDSVYSVSLVSQLSNSLTFSNKIYSKIGRSSVYLVLRPSHQKWFSCASLMLDRATASSSLVLSTILRASSILFWMMSCMSFYRCSGSVLLRLSRLRPKSCAISSTIALALSKSQLCMIAENAQDNSFSIVASVFWLFLPQIWDSSSCLDCTLSSLKRRSMAQRLDKGPNYIFIDYNLGSTAGHLHPPHITFMARVLV